MEICANCFKNNPDDFLFCPRCGYPTGKIGFRQCGSGHTIYETFKSCVICEQSDNIGTSFIDSSFVRINSDAPGPVTEVVQSGPGDTVVEEMTQPDKTVLEEATTPANPFPDKTTIEDFYEKTRLDTTQGNDKTRIHESPIPLSPFYAWLVSVGDDGLPREDSRLINEKTIIGKGNEADIQVIDEFVSRLHTLIYFENDQFHLSDLGSTNGTFLNGLKVMKEQLKDGDSIRVGRQSMIFKRVIKKTA